MKKLILLTVLAGALPLSIMAQDDLYFTPSKSAKESTVKTIRTDDSPAYYSGSNRDVDEYNRRGKLSSYYQKIGSDSLGNDIIQFHAGNGQYPDSLVLDTIYPGSQQFYGDNDDSFAYSRRMNRFDNDYGWYDPYFYSDLYWDYPYYGYGWGPYWSAGWGWYDPWYYGWGWRGYYGWYDPWYAGYWGWGGPWYYGGWGGPGYAWHGRTGTRGHGFEGGRSYANGNYRPNTGNRTFGNFGNGRSSFGNGRTGTRGTWGNTTAGNARTGGWKGSQQYNPGNSNFNNTRSYTPSRVNTNTNSTRSFGNGGSFGSGSRSFGGGGASHSFGGGGGHSFGGGGGGHFGGGRR